MARIRTIKPDFWTDEKIGSLKREERLLFIGLWNLADDQGVVKSNPSYIKGQLFSYDEDLRLNAVKDWLASLTKARFLIPFSHQGEGYFLIRTFHEHQLINRPSKPKFSSQLIQSILENTHGALTEYSQPEIEGKGNRKEGSEEAPEAPRITTPDEQEFKDVQAWMKQNTPEVLKMKEPLSKDQYFKLKDRYGPEFVCDILLKMHNWKDLNKKRTNAYLTFLNSFAAREKDNAA